MAASSSIAEEVFPLKKLSDDVLLVLLKLTPSDDIFFLATVNKRIYQLWFTYCKTPIQLSSFFVNIKRARWAFENLRDIKNQYGCPLKDKLGNAVAKKGNVSVMQSFLSKGFYYQSRALEIALENGHVDVSVILYKIGTGIGPPSWYHIGKSGSYELFRKFRGMDVDSFLENRSEFIRGLMEMKRNESIIRLINEECLSKDDSILQNQCLYSRNVEMFDYLSQEIVAEIRKGFPSSMFNFGHRTRSCYLDINRISDVMYERIITSIPSLLSEMHIRDGDPERYTHDTYVMFFETNPDIKNVKIRDYIRHFLRNGWADLMNYLLKLHNRSAIVDVSIKEFSMCNLNPNLELTKWYCQIVAELPEEQKNTFLTNLLDQISKSPENDVFEWMLNEGYINRKISHQLQGRCYNGTIFTEQFKKYLNYQIPIDWDYVVHESRLSEDSFGSVLASVCGLVRLFKFLIDHNSRKCIQNIKERVSPSLYEKAVQTMLVIDPDCTF